MNGRKVRQGTARVIAGALIVAMLSLGGVDASGADPSTKVLVAVFDDFSSGSIQFEVEGIPSEVEADNYKVTFANGSIGPHVLIEFKIPDGWTSEQLLAALDSEEPPEGAFFVNAVFAKPGQQHQKQYDLTLPGTYGYFCPITTPAGVPHFDLGFVGVFEVT